MFFDETENNFSYEDNDYSFEFEKENNTNNYSNYEGTNNFIFNNYRPTSLMSNVEVGFARGTMFNAIYDNYYKRIKKLVPTNEREKMLLKIQELSFASLDLSMHLDLHPKDTEVLNMFKSYNKELNEMTKKYESIYGPLTSQNETGGTGYEWNKNPWPWEKGGIR